MSVCEYTNRSVGQLSVFLRNGSKYFSEILNEVKRSKSDWAEFFG